MKISTKRTKFEKDFERTGLPQILIAALSFDEKEFNKYCDDLNCEEFVLSIRQLMLLGLEEYYSRAKNDPRLKKPVSNIKTLIDRLYSSIKGG